MTRAERRRAERQEAKLSVTYNMDKRAIDKIKSDAVWEGIDTAFILMMGLPISILQDKFGQLMRKEGRAETFVELLLERYEMFKEGYFTLDDLLNDLHTEAGVSIPGIVYTPGSCQVKFEK